MILSLGSPLPQGKTIELKNKDALIFLRASYLHRKARVPGFGQLAGRDSLDQSYIFVSDLATFLNTALLFAVKQQGNETGPKALCSKQGLQ